VKYSRKTDESILAKARRPAILESNPRFGVEHVRDTFRFKAVVFSFRDALSFIFAMDQSHELCPGGGLSPANVAKLDIAKLTKPKEWGWRFLAFDFVMPNHQIVECYVVFTEMELAKKAEDPDAAVCPELSNHEIFEKWRVVKTSALTGDGLAEFEADKAESNRRYDAAFAQVQSHTTPAEQEAFWRPFGVDPNDPNDNGKQIGAKGLANATMARPKNDAELFISADNTAASNKLMFSVNNPIQEQQQDDATSHHQPAACNQNERAIL